MLYRVRFLQKTYGRAIGVLQATIIEMEIYEHWLEAGAATLGFAAGA